MASISIVHRDKSVILQLRDDGVNYLFCTDGNWSVSAEARPGLAAALTRRFNRGWVLLDPLGLPCIVNGLRVADLKLIHQHDEIRLGEATARLFEIERQTVDKQSPLLNADCLCPIDQEPFIKGHEIVRCPVCETPHHAECWDWARNCGNCGRPHGSE